MTEETKEIAPNKDTVKDTVKDTTIAKANPRGHGHVVDPADIIIPRIMLIQYTPPKKVELPPEIGPGKIINNVTVTELTKDDKGRVEFIPVLRSVNWVRFNPQNENDPNFDPQYEPGAVIWRSDNPEDARVIAEGAWGQHSEPPLATKFINYLLIVPSEPIPMMVSFGKTSFEAGKRLTTFSQMYHEADDLFAWKYFLAAKQQQNDQKQKYFVFTVDQAGKCSENEYKRAERFYERFAGKELKIEGDEEAVESADKKPWQ